MKIGFWGRNPCFGCVLGVLGENRVLGSKPVFWVHSERFGGKGKSTCSRSRARGCTFLLRRPQIIPLTAAVRPLCPAPLSSMQVRSEGPSSLCWSSRGLEECGGEWVLPPFDSDREGGALACLSPSPSDVWPFGRKAPFSGGLRAVATPSDHVRDRCCLPPLGWMAHSMDPCVVRAPREDRSRTRRGDCIGLGEHLQLKCHHS